MLLVFPPPNDGFPHAERSNARLMSSSSQHEPGRLSAPPFQQNGWCSARLTILHFQIGRQYRCNLLAIIKNYELCPFICSWRSLASVDSGSASKVLSHDDSLLQVSLLLARNSQCDSHCLESCPLFSSPAPCLDFDESVRARGLAGHLWLIHLPMLSRYNFTSTGP